MAVEISFEIVDRETPRGDFLRMIIQDRIVTENRAVFPISCYQHTNIKIFEPCYMPLCLSSWLDNRGHNMRKI